jgi:hypothetical protein
MTFSLSPLTPGAPTATAAVPGPYVARITNVGKQITCSPSTTGNFATNLIWRESFRAPFLDIRGFTPDSVFFRSPLPAQESSLIVLGSPAPGRNFLGPIWGITCIPPTITLSTPGFPDRRMSTFATLRTFVSGGQLIAECQAHVRGPVSSIQDRPAQLIAAGGDRFTYVCDVAAAQRRSVCSSGICTIQCTSNVTAPIDTAGVNQCINSCADRCAATPCAPILCTGSACPSGCAPQNVCTSNAQCGAGRECGGSGCCITIIR